jgi:hypothetical protein
MNVRLCARPTKRENNPKNVGQQVARGDSSTIVATSEEKNCWTREISNKNKPLKANHNNHHHHNNSKLFF